MYGLPKDFDGTFLVGRILEMVCFSQYQVYLHFDSEITITIESSISYQNDEIITIPFHNFNLIELIGKPISEVSSDDKGTLCLVFKKEKILKIYDTSKQYESYSIANKGKVIII